MFYEPFYPIFKVNGFFYLLDFNQIIKDMWSVIDSESISNQIIIDLFDGVETDLEEKVQINSKTELSEFIINLFPSNLHFTIEFFFVLRIISVKILEFTVASPFFEESVETNSLIEISISVDLISIWLLSHFI